MMEFPVTISLIVANVLVSLIGLSNRDFFTDNSFWIAPIRDGRQWWRFVKSAFLHVNLTHLLINMYVLWEFGRVLERSLGATTFLIIYGGSLLGGNLWEYFDKKDQPDYRAVGASGATSGVILSFSVLAPFALLGLFFIIPMWAIVAAALFISVSFFLSRRPNTMIAHGAHLGGALAGAALTFLLVPGSWSRLITQVAERLG